MFDLSQINLDAQYVLLKGEPGTRKSTQALSWPKPQYWFSWDQKMNSLLLPIKKWGYNIKEIHADNYTDWSSAENKLKQFKLNCNYRTLVIDSVTTMVDGTLAQTRELKKDTTKQSGQQSGRKIAGITVNELEDYNAESAALAELIKLTKDIKDFHKVNVIMIAHVIQAEYRNNMTNVTHISRQIVTASKKTAPKIPAVCEEVYHFNIKRSIEADKGGEYALLTTHTGDDFARTSLPLNNEIVFGDRPLYPDFIKPAIDEMKKFIESTKQTTQQPTSNNSFEVK